VLKRDRVQARPSALRAKTALAAAGKDVVVPEPSFRIPAVLLAASALSASQGATPVAAVTGILGAFLTVQATRVKFVFTQDDNLVCPWRLTHRASTCSHRHPRDPFHLTPLLSSLIPCRKC